MKIRFKPIMEKLNEDMGFLKGLDFEQLDNYMVIILIDENET